MSNKSVFGYLPRYIQCAELSANKITSNGKEIQQAESVVILTQQMIDDGILNEGLSTGKLYIVDGTINVSGYTIEVPNTGLQIKGYGFDISTILQTDENATLFSSPVGGSGNLLLTELSIVVPGTGSRVFGLTDASGFNATEFNVVNFNGCSDLGFLDGYRQGLEDGTGRFGGTPSLEFRGTSLGGYRITTSIVRGVSDTVFSLFRCDPSHTFGSRFGGNPNIFLPANVTAFEMIPANFASDELFQLDDANFEGDGTVLDGLTEKDKEVRITASRGVMNTYVGGFWRCTTPVTTVITVQNDLYFLEGVTTPNGLTWFSQSANNTIVLDSSIPIMITVTLIGSFSGPNNRQYTMRIRIYDDSAGTYIDDDSYATAFTTEGNGRKENVTLITPRISLEQNDRIEAWIANTGGTENITMQTESRLIITEG